MGRYITQAPRVKKQQVFTVSGIFTPSPGLLATGGVVEVRCVGGGGGGGLGSLGVGPGGTNIHAKPGGGGGSGADITRIVTITGPVIVLVGAGGTGETFGHAIPPVSQLAEDGGNTSFGSMVVAAGGKAGSRRSGGRAGGEGGFHGHSDGNGGGAGGGVRLLSLPHPYDGGFVAERVNGRPNSGGGGATASTHTNAGGDSFPNDGESGFVCGTGGSGLCIVTWEE